MTIQFRVTGKPEGQPRVKARAVKNKNTGKSFATVYTPKTNAGFKDDVMIQARRHKPVAPLTGPLRVDIEAIFRRPKKHFWTGKRAHLLRDDAPTMHTRTPDRDNVDKLILDALTNVGFWLDDCQVCAGEVRKRYADPGEETGAIITICEEFERRERQPA